MSEDIEPEQVLEYALTYLLDADRSLAEAARDIGFAPLLDGNGEPVRVDRVRTYGEAGVLTTDRGLVVNLSDGSEYQVSIRCSRTPEG